MDSSGIDVQKRAWAVRQIMYVCLSQGWQASDSLPGPGQTKHRMFGLGPVLNPRPSVYVVTALNKQALADSNANLSATTRLLIRPELY